MTELDPDILAIAEKAGLNENKKNMLVSKEIINYPDKEIMRYVQKVLLGKLVKASDKKSKYLRDQEIRNLRAGNVYIKDPVSKQIVKNEHNIDRIPMTKEIEKRMEYHKSVEFIIDFQSTINDLLEELTGTEEHDFDERVVKNTQGYRIDIFKRMQDIDLGRIYNKMFAVKAAIDDAVQLLDLEMDAREANKKLLTE